ncbi:MAG: hypothetical protein QOJ40_2734, partial [Verrucomicrobiota bacterium]
MKTQENIPQLFETKKQQTARQITERETQVKELEQSAVALGKELKKLDSLAQQLRESGASSEDLSRQVLSKQQEIENVKSRADEARSRIAELKTSLEKLEPSLWLIDYSRNILKEEKIRAISATADLYPLAKIGIQTTDGHPSNLDVSFSLGKGCSSKLMHELSVSQGETRVIKGFMPAELRWIPKDWLLVESSVSIDYERNYCEQSSENGNRDEGRLSRIYFIGGEERLMPTTDTLGWRVRNARYKEPSPHAFVYRGNQPQEPEWFDQERNIGTDLPSFSQTIEAEISAAGGKIDLGAEYARGTFLCFLRDSIFAVTVPAAQNEFEQAGQPLKPEEIANRIQPYWERFVRGPWLANVDGLLANLKYYCESGERPRFFSRTIKDSFGFRVRTRDHSWICGSIFLLPEGDKDASADETAVQIRETDEDSEMDEEG